MGATASVAIPEQLNYISFQSLALKQGVPIDIEEIRKLFDASQSFFSSTHYVHRLPSTG